jgi:hypothetical protein
MKGDNSGRECIIVKQWAGIELSMSQAMLPQYSAQESAL